MAWFEYLNTDPTEWLLNSNSWTRYKTLTDILDKNENDPEVFKAKSSLLDEARVHQLAKETKEWIKLAPTRNNDPKISYFKLRILADFGIKYTELPLKETLRQATAHIVDDMFGIRGQLPERPKRGEKFEKPDLGADVWHIAPCNSPVLTSILIDLGIKDDALNRAIHALELEWMKKEGWFCHLFFVESQFKKLKVGCPMAGLVALDVFSKLDKIDKEEIIENAFNPIRFHKEYGKSIYYFGRSKKFWTFKYPFVWYNALYLGEVLSRYPEFKNEPIMKEIIEWIIKNGNEEGRFRPNSMFMAYKGWDFANKKEDSPWITFLSCRILKRYYTNN